MTHENGLPQFEIRNPALSDFQSYYSGEFPKVDGLRSIEFGTPGASRDRLIDFVLHGHKRATAGLFREYESEGEPIEHVGELLAMVDNVGRHVGKLEVTRVELLRFADLPDEFVECIRLIAGLFSVLQMKRSIN